jgi:hypothetical protein
VRQLMPGSRKLRRQRLSDGPKKWRRQQDVGFGQTRTSSSAYRSGYRQLSNA